MVSCIVRQFAAMTTAASCALATSAGGAVVAFQAARNHSASARPCSKASFVKSEFFSSNVALSARTVGASHPVSVRRSSVLVVCGKVRVLIKLLKCLLIVNLNSWRPVLISIAMPTCGPELEVANCSCNVHRLVYLCRTLSLCSAEYAVTRL